MLKNNYYCIVAGLPELFFDENKKVENSLEFLADTKKQVNETDYRLIEMLFLEKSNRHVLNIHLNMDEPLNSNHTHILPPLPYIIEFLEWANGKPAKKMKLEFENKLHTLYFNHVLTTQNSFLKKWFTLELNIKNILTAFNCKQFNYPIEKHLIKTKHGNTVYSLLKNNQLKHKLFEDEIPLVKQIFDVAKAEVSPEIKEKEIDRLKWEYLDEQTCYHYFTIEQILSYVIKLLITERWAKMDAEKGKIFLTQLINDLKKSYKLSHEFNATR